MPLTLDKLVQWKEYGSAMFILYYINTQKERHKLNLMLLIADCIHTDLKHVSTWFIDLYKSY